MYDNPKHIKKHPVKSRYDDFEREHVAYWAERSGEQIATFQRQAMLFTISLLEKHFDEGEPVNFSRLEQQFKELEVIKRGA